MDPVASRVSPEGPDPSRHAETARKARAFIGDVDARPSAEPAEL